MVIINLEVAFARDFKIKQAVTRKQIEHVIEERQPCADQRLSIAVEIEDNTHVCLVCLSVDLSDPLLCNHLVFHHLVSPEFLEVPRAINHSLPASQRSRGNNPSTSDSR